MFDKFETKPIASASLAQVHVAREKGTGRKLAVKVQHRGLRETSRGDLMALESVVRLVDGLFDEFKWGWIVDEIAPNVRCLHLIQNYFVVVSQREFVVAKYLIFHLVSFFSVT